MAPWDLIRGARESGCNTFLPPIFVHLCNSTRSETDAWDAGGGGKEERLFFIFGAAISYRALGLYILSVRRPSRRLLYPTPAPQPRKGGNYGVVVVVSIYCLFESSYQYTMYKTVVCERAVKYINTVKRDISQ